MSGPHHQLIQEQLEAAELQFFFTKNHYRQSFQDLLKVLKLPSNTDPFNFSLNSIKACDEPQPNATSHPNICFWHRVDYDSWLDSPAAKQAQCGTVPFLKDKSGQPITATWAELVVRDIAPSTWARLCSMGNLVFRQIMERDFPIFQLNSDGWKLKRLCTNDYPNWHKNQLDFDGMHWRWKTSDKKAAKQETLSEDDMDILPEKKPVFEHKGKKHAHLPDSTSLIKHMKDAPMDSTISSFSSNDKTQVLPLILSLSPWQPDSSLLHGVYLPQPPSHRDNKENMPVFLRNPLANMFTMKAPPPLLNNLNSPLHPCANPSTSASTSTAMTIMSAVLTSSTATPTPTTSSGTSASASKGSKICPGPKKNGRNLCALRWLKQLNTKGTTKEFDSYWCARLAAQKDKYQAEAERLESAGQWQKVLDALIANGILH
ncbi:hypothetical protein DFH29DRAFT_880325 [Suillus ampliporus]|nr:hypothetical protein DFH29DRAFT_880325 [Suillus ampliporus]